MSDIKDKAMGFEARKVSLSQNKDGIILRLSIHPDDVPRQLWTDWVGQTYMIGMTRVGDDGAPEKSPEMERADRAIASAGMLCRNPEFQRFLHEGGFSEGTSEADTIAGLREMLGIKSRKEMREHPDIVADFEQLKEQFTAWRQTRGLGQD